MTVERNKEFSRLLQLAVPEGTAYINELTRKLTYRVIFLNIICRLQWLFRVSGREWSFPVPIFQDILTGDAADLICHLQYTEHIGHMKTLPSPYQRRYEFTGSFELNRWVLLSMI